MTHWRFNTEYVWKQHQGLNNPRPLHQFCNKFKMSHQKTIQESFCPTVTVLLSQPVQWIVQKQTTKFNCEQQSLQNVENCSQIIKFSTRFSREHVVMLSLQSSERFLCSAKYRAAMHIVRAFLSRDFRTNTKACLNTREFFCAYRGSLSDTEISSTNGKQMKKREMIDKTSERNTTNVQSIQTSWLHDHTWLCFKNGAVCGHFCCKLKANPFGSAVVKTFQHQLVRGKDQGAVHEAMRDTFNKQQHHVMRG